jgi:thioredoxin-related protein
MFSILLAVYTVKAQPVTIYHPEADAKAEIQQATVKANAENKHVFLQIGGNWCPWCIKFHNFVNDHKEIQDYVNQNFVVLKVNYSKENKNLDVLEKLNFPQRFGFPVFVILDGAGKRIHTQNSAYLEENEGYSEKKVLEFFKHWSPAALTPDNYTK